MKTKKLVELAKSRAARHEQLLNSPAVQRVLGFFVAKGFLHASFELPYAPNAKLQIQDVLLVGREVEPRVFEVLPAALLSFPRSFLHQEELPHVLKQCIAALRAGTDLDCTYRGIPFSAMKHWAAKQLPDGRTKPVTEKKVNRSYRLTPAIAAKLRTMSKNSGLTETAYLENLIRKDAQSEH